MNESWEILKTSLTLAPTLAFPDFRKDFILYCDSSKQREYSTALHQVQEGVEHAVLCLSKTLNKYKKNYWPTELEMRCLVWSIDKLKHFLDDLKSRIIVVTNYWALKWILNLRADRTTKKNTCLANWALILHKFANCMDIKHCFGTEHKNSNGLLRLRNLDNTALPAFYMSVQEMSKVLKVRVREEVRANNYSGAMYSSMKKQLGSTGCRDRNNLYIGEDELFYLSTQD